MLFCAVLSLLAVAAAAQFHVYRPFVAPLANNPSVQSYGYGFLGPQNRDYMGYLDAIGTREPHGWGAFRPAYYNALDRRVHPWKTAATGILPWASTFHGNGLDISWGGQLDVDGVWGEGSADTRSDLYTNSLVNPLGANPTLPGGASPLLAGANPYGFQGIGSINLGTPVGLSYMGNGAGTGVGWLQHSAGHPLPYMGYGPQGSGGIGTGAPLTEHPIFQTLPGLYHPPASNVFF